MEITYDNTCPHCKKAIQDLWDYEWRGTNYIETECPHCEKDIFIETDVVYRIGGKIESEPS